ncbi:hypothetical protein ACUXPF_001972, partial [Sphingomonas sanguinis]
MKGHAGGGLAVVLCIQGARRSLKSNKPVRM